MTGNIKAGVVNVEQMGNSLKPDSNKSMGHSPEKHLPRVHGAPTTDNSRTKEVKHGIKAVAAMANTPLNTTTKSKGYKKP